MDQTMLILLAVVAVAVIAGVLLLQRRRSQHLKSRFGPEYDHELEEKGSRSKAEAELAKREKRVSKLDIVPLEPAARQQFVERWTDVQAKFVDDPARAVAYADALLAEVMSARGYPVGDFDQRAGDISVDHPKVVEHYRAGHEVAVRHERGEAGTEDLRQAMIHYRSLFDELVGENERSPQPEAAH
ncbi:MAG: hypothetical protein H0T81_01180 [Sphingomonas sp.]|nr:hypothetical protein [Sphingomonas sp.]